MKKRLCSRLGIVLIIVVSIFLLTAAAALAASNAAVDPSRPFGPRSDLEAATLGATGMVSHTEPISGSNMIDNAISLFFSVDVTRTVPVTDVVNLRSDGYGYGEIAKLYFLANFLGLNPDLGLGFDDAVTVIRATREISKTGWGRLTMDFGLRPGNHGCNLGMIVSGRGTLEECLADRAAEESSADVSATGNKGRGNSNGDKEHGNPHADKQHGNPHGDEHPGQGQGRDKDKGNKGGKKK